MNYQDKYFKYKLKYLKTKLLKKKQEGGSIVDTQNSILLAISTVSSLYNIYKKTKNKYHKNLKNTISLSKKTDDKKTLKKLKKLKDLTKKYKKQDEEQDEQDEEQAEEVEPTEPEEVEPTEPEEVEPTEPEEVEPTEPGEKYGEQDEEQNEQDEEQNEQDEETVAEDEEPVAEDEEPIDLNTKLENIGLLNNCNKCWENSTIQVLFHMKDFRDLVLSLRDDNSYQKELKNKLDIIKNKYERKDLGGNYVPETDTDMALVIPALYSLFSELYKLGTNPDTNRDNFYQNYKEHFIFVENGNFISDTFENISPPYPYNIQGDPSDLLRMINIYNHNNWSDMDIKSGKIKTEQVIQSELYTEETKNIFGFEKIEIISLIHKSSSNEYKIYYKYFNKANKELSTIHTYTNIIGVPIIYSRNIDMNSKDIYNNKLHYYTLNNNNNKKTLFKFEDYIKNLNIQYFLNEFVFNKIEFNSIDKVYRPTKNGGLVSNPSYEATVNKDIICDNFITKSINNNEKTSIKLLTIERTLYIKVPKYFMVTLGETNLNFTDNFTYDKIQLPKLNTTNINNPILVNYSLISVICHPEGHFYSIINTDNGWTKFNDSYVSVLPDNEYRQDIKKYGKFFIYKIDNNDNSHLQKVDLNNFNLDTLLKIN